MAKKKLKKALMLGAALAGGLGLAKARRNKAIDAGIAAADEEPGAQIKNYGPYKKSKVANVASTTPNWINTNDPHQFRWPMNLKKGGRVTGIAKRGFGRALMKGKK
jgi:hypothetical protein